MGRIFLQVAALLLMAQTANGALIINVTDDTGDLVISAVGSLDLTGADSKGEQPFNKGIIPGGSNWYLAPGSGDATDAYGLTAAEVPFGTSTTFFDSPASVSGNSFFIFGNFGATPAFGVPSGYLSGDAISSGMIFINTTIADFTLIPGTYNFSLPNDAITLNIGPVSAVPIPAAAWLFGSALLGLGASKRRNSKLI